MKKTVKFKGRAGFALRRVAGDVRRWVKTGAAAPHPEMPARQASKALPTATASAEPGEMHAWRWAQEVKARHGQDVVFHGTTHDFDPEEWRTGQGKTAYGVFFGDDPRTAAIYAPPGDGRILAVKIHAKRVADLVEDEGLLRKLSAAARLHDPSVDDEDDDGFGRIRDSHANGNLYQDSYGAWQNDLMMAAEHAGYEAVRFNDVSDVSTVVFDRSVVEPLEQLRVERPQRQRTTRRPGMPSADTPSEPGYVYHATNYQRALEIAEDGQMRTHKPWEHTDQDAWPDGATGKRTYWTANAGGAWVFAPEEGRPVLLRAKETAAHKYEAHTGDVYTERPVPAKSLDIMLSDGSWEKLTDHADAQRGPARQASSPAPRLLVPTDGLERVKNPEFTKGASPGFEARLPDGTRWYVKPGSAGDAHREVVSSALGEALGLSVVRNAYWRDEQGLGVASRVEPGTASLLDVDLRSRRARVGGFEDDDLGGGAVPMTAVGRGRLARALGVDPDFAQMARDAGGLIFLDALVGNGDPGFTAHPGGGNYGNVLYRADGRVVGLDWAMAAFVPLLKHNIPLDEVADSVDGARRALDDAWPYTRAHVTGGLATQRHLVEGFEAARARFERLNLDVLAMRLEADAGGAATGALDPEGAKAVQGALRAAQRAFAAGFKGRAGYELRKVAKGVRRWTRTGDAPSAARQASFGPVVDPLAPSGHRLVSLDAKKLDEAWRKDTGFHVGPGGEGGIPGRYPRAQAFTPTEDNPFRAPMATMDPATGRLSVIDGRHRIAVARDRGDAAITVSMDPDSIREAERRGLVAGRQASLVLPMRLMERQIVSRNHQGDRVHLDGRDYFLKAADDASARLEVGGAHLGRKLGAATPRNLLVHDPEANQPWVASEWVDGLPLHSIRGRSGEFGAPGINDRQDPNLALGVIPTSPEALRAWEEKLGAPLDAHRLAGDVGRAAYLAALLGDTDNFTTNSGNGIVGRDGRFYTLDFTAGEFDPLVKGFSPTKAEFRTFRMRERLTPRSWDHDPWFGDHPERHREILRAALDGFADADARFKALKLPKERAEYERLTERPARQASLVKPRLLVEPNAERAGDGGTRAALQQTISEGFFARTEDGREWYVKAPPRTGSPDKGSVHVANEVTASAIGDLIGARVPLAARYQGPTFGIEKHEWQRDYTYQDFSASLRVPGANLREALALASRADDGGFEKRLRWYLEDDDEIARWHRENYTRAQLEAFARDQPAERVKVPMWHDAFLLGGVPRDHTHEALERALGVKLDREQLARDAGANLALTRVMGNTDSAVRMVNPSNGLIGADGRLYALDWAFSDGNPIVAHYDKRRSEEQQLVNAQRIGDLSPFRERLGEYVVGWGDVKKTDPPVTAAERRLGDAAAEGYESAIRRFADADLDALASRLADETGYDGVFARTDLGHVVQEAAQRHLKGEAFDPARSYAVPGFKGKAGYSLRQVAGGIHRWVRAYREEDRRPSRQASQAAPQSQRVFEVLRRAEAAPDPLGSLPNALARSQALVDRVAEDILTQAPRSREVVEHLVFQGRLPDWFRDASAEEWARLGEHMRRVRPQLALDTAARLTKPGVDPKAAATYLQNRLGYRVFEFEHKGGVNGDPTLTTHIVGGKVWSTLEGDALRLLSPRAGTVEGFAMPGDASGWVLRHEWGHALDEAERNGRGPLQLIYEASAQEPLNGLTNALHSRIVGSDDWAFRRADWHQLGGETPDHWDDGIELRRQARENEGYAGWLPGEVLLAGDPAGAASRMPEKGGRSQWEKWADRPANPYRRLLYPLSDDYGQVAMGGPAILRDEFPTVLVELAQHNPEHLAALDRLARDGGSPRGLREALAEHMNGDTFPDPDPPRTDAIYARLVSPDGPAPQMWSGLILK